MSALSRASLVAMLVALGGCDEASDCSDAACACGPGIDSPGNDGQIHVIEPTPVSYAHNPPASGNHWPLWDTSWGTYPTPLPRERWVHNLEHGGVVLLYNCPDGCADDVAQLKAIKNGMRPDRYNEVRIIITPDPLMPRRFAAVAWGFRWQGDSLDTGVAQCFIAARYDRAPESVP